MPAKGYRAGLCRQGHDDWHIVESSEKRYCRACALERTKKRRAAQPKREPKPLREVCRNGHSNWRYYFGRRLCETCHEKRSAKYSSYWATYRRHLRMEVLLAYGGQCKCCGETQYEFLCLDHVNNDGALDRRRNLRSYRLHQWAKDNDYPPTLQVLCHNCNQAKFLCDGICPHQRDLC